MSSRTFADLGVSQPLWAPSRAAASTLPSPCRPSSSPTRWRVTTSSPSPPPAPARRSPSSSRPPAAVAEDPRAGALVLAPTRELAGQIVYDARDVAEARGLSIAAVYGGVGMSAR